MKIVHRYVLSLSLRNLLLSILVFTTLFTVIDFIDRIDNLISEGTSILTAIQYFSFKIPLTISLMIPVAMLVTTLFTFGMLSKNSEIIAMRAAGMKLSWIARPLFGLALALSLATILLNETVVPYATRRVKEIYNIDIRQKDQRGSYNQENFWWRDKSHFYRVGMFDSRESEFLDFSRFELDRNFEIKRTSAKTANYIDPVLGWQMRQVVEYEFDGAARHGGSQLSAQHPVLKPRQFRELPLPINAEPRDFYDAKTDPHTMSYLQLNNFISKQSENGIRVNGYLADLYSKLAFPFVTFLVTLAVLPFCLRPARSGSMSSSVLIGLLIAFSYYAINSFSIAIGRAELWHPLLAAWMANVLLLAIGLVLSLGQEAP